MKWKQQILGMKPYKPGKPVEEVQREFGLDEVVKLASNENPFGFSPKVKQFLAQDQSHHLLQGLRPSINVRRDAVQRYMRRRPELMTPGVSFS